MVVVVVVVLALAEIGDTFLCDVKRKQFVVIVIVLACLIDAICAHAANNFVNSAYSINRITLCIELQTVEFLVGGVCGGRERERAQHCNYFKRRGANMFAASTIARIEHVASCSNVLRLLRFVHFPPQSGNATRRERNVETSRCCGSSTKNCRQIINSLHFACLCFCAANVREIKRRQIEQCKSRSQIKLIKVCK